MCFTFKLVKYYGVVFISSCKTLEKTHFCFGVDFILGTNSLVEVDLNKTIPLLRVNSSEKKITDSLRKAEFIYRRPSLSSCGPNPLLELTNLRKSWSFPEEYLS